MTGSREFVCNQCGDCCKNLGKENVVVLQSEDISRLAENLSIEESKLIKDYLQPNTGLSEIAGKPIYQLRSSAGRCVFLNTDELCGVHEFKPEQCAQGPTHFMSKSMLGYECMKGVSIVDTSALDNDFFNRLINRARK